MERKSTSERGRFFYIYLLIENVRVRQTDDSEFESFLLLNHSKFAVECDQNSKISQIRTNLFFWEKNLGFFRNKNMIFFSKSFLANLL